MKCKGCGKEFISTNKKGRGNKGPRVYCSPECRDKNRQRNYREAHPKEYNDQQIRSYQNHREDRIANQIRRRRAKGDIIHNKQNANAKVRNAVEAGKLIKPSICSKCGIVPRRIEAHHHKGYEHPLDVVWLCTSCHQREHKIISK